MPHAGKAVERRSFQAKPRPKPKAKLPWQKKKVKVTKRKLKKKYAKMVDALEDMIHDAIVSGMSNKELYDKYRPQVLKPFQANSMGQALTYAGVNKLRKKVRDAQGKLETQKRNQLVKQKAEKVAKVAIDRVTKGAEKHFNRMDKIVDKAHEAIDNLSPLTDTPIEDYLNVSDKFDKLARRTYNMDKVEQVSDHQRNLAFLIHGDVVIERQEEAQSQLTEPPPEPIEIEATPVD